MASFQDAFDATMRAEGGYVNDPQDPGGETYKGIARKMQAKWAGWVTVDLLKRRPGFPRNLDADTALQGQVRDFYESQFWDRVRGDEIVDQAIAESIFDFAVNAGPVTSIKLAQLSVRAEADGVIGSDTLARLNADDPRAFLAVFALNKIARYVSICEKRPDSRKFFFGWVRRTLEGL